MKQLSIKLDDKFYNSMQKFIELKGFKTQSDFIRYAVELTIKNNDNNKIILDKLSSESAETRALINKLIDEILIKK